MSKIIAIKDPILAKKAQFFPELSRVHVNDMRYYKHPETGVYYPSVTTILGSAPKGKWFEDWLKETGMNADLIRDRAGMEGTIVHESIEKYLEGEELIWIDSNGYPKYPQHVWQMILKFAEFWEREKPELVASEFYLFNDEDIYAGTMDLTVIHQNKRKIWDIKTSNHLHPSYFWQLGAYVRAWNRLFPEAPVEETAVIWLKASTRGEDKKGKSIQGKGWQLKVSPHTPEEDYQSFLKIYDVFKLEHQEDEPNDLIIPNSVKKSW